MTKNDLSDDQLIDNIISLAIGYRQRFGKSLGVTSEIGEYKASKLLMLDRAQGNINKGFDAVDSEGKKVQIKSRICSRNKGRTGVFKNYDFDYAVLVLMSEKYEIICIYKLGKQEIKEEIERQHYTKNSLPINKFIKIAKQVYSQ